MSQNIIWREKEAYGMLSLRKYRQRLAPILDTPSKFIAKFKEYVLCSICCLGRLIQCPLRQSSWLYDFALHCSACIVQSTYDCIHLNSLKWNKLKILVSQLH